MDKQKIIEAMHYAHQDCLCNADGTVEEAWEAVYNELVSMGVITQKELTQKEIMNSFCTDRRSKDD